ncbi:L-type lectin-domain containing receptor kinase VIII.1 [Rosa sericea]
MSCFNWLLYLASALAVIQNGLLVDSASDKKHRNGPVVNVTKHLIFPDFNLSYNPRMLNDVKLLGSAKLASKTSAIQIPDESHVTDLRHQAGRAIYSSSIRLLDPHTETPASFETTFSFQFHNASSPSAERIQTTQGGGYGNGGSGLAFVIVPDEFTVGRPGAWLAMLNDACEDDYKAIAIEFDTRLNPEFGDPNDNHVGINLGTIISTETINASDVGVFLNDGSVHRAWISYNGSRRWMDIRLGSDDGSYPSKPVFSGSLDLSPYLNEYMFVGFSASTGNHTQIHSVLSWNFTSVSQAFLRVPSMETCESKIVVTETPRAEPPGTFLIFIAVLALAIAVMLSLYYNSKRRNANSDSASIVLPEKKQRPRPPNKPRSFTISEISLATRSFGELEILGGGSKGVCYRGKLSNGCQVAVKRFSPQFLNSQGLDRRRLMKEIKGISRVRHPNLVSIRGWCQDKKETMVVYEFFSNGSLDKWLFGVGVLPWTRRFKVVRDVAEALSYLHSNQLAHKNLKTTNVFLDVSFRAVLGDFGFVLCGAESRKFESTVSQSTDVFEFGLFVLEVVGGRKRLEAELGELEERDLLDFTWRMHEIGEMRRVVDKRMGAVINLDQAIRVLEIGLLCTLNASKGRPSMEQVVEFLCMERPIPELPQTRPAALFPYNSTNALCTGYSCAPFK